MREYLPLGSSDAETAALSESLLGRAGGSGGGSPGGRRKGRVGSPQYSGMAAGGAGDVERGGGSEALLPATPARCGAPGDALCAARRPHAGTLGCPALRPHSCHLSKESRMCAALAQGGRDD